MKMRDVCVIVPATTTAVSACERGDWRLVSVRHAGFDRITGRASERTLTDDEIGEVTLAASVWDTHSTTRHARLRG